MGEQHKDEKEIQRNYMLGQSVAYEAAAAKAMGHAQMYFRGDADTLAQAFRILSKELTEMANNCRPEPR